MITGLALIPLILLGIPTQAGYLVVGFSVLSLLAVFIPLWGVHEQMGNAKAKLLQVMNQQLLDDQTQWLNADIAGATELQRLSERIGILLQLRKMVSEAPSWPFRNEAGAGTCRHCGGQPPDLLHPQPTHPEVLVGGFDALKRGARPENTTRQPCHGPPRCACSIR